MMFGAAAIVSSTEKVREGMEVSPGLTGFVVIALLVMAFILLMRSMTYRIRNIDHSKRRAEAEAELKKSAAEAAAKKEATKANAKDEASS